VYKMEGKEFKMEGKELKFIVRLVEKGCIDNP
jgi:hypothetical protein